MSKKQDTDISKRKHKKKNVNWVMTLVIGISIVVLVIAVTFPLIFDYKLLGKAHSSNISCDDWPGFMGSYAGGIIGGLLGSIATILGVYLTLRDQQIQAKDERRLSVRPALYFLKCDESESEEVDSWSIFEFNTAQNDKYTKEESCCVLLKTENLGPGQITKIMLNIEELGESGIGKEYSLVKNGESIYWKYEFKLKYNEESKYFSQPLTFNFYYKDIYNNVYLQTVHAFLQKSQAEEDGIEVESPPAVTLTGEVTQPKLVKKIPYYMKKWQ